jgi:hypothetical protein
VSPSSALSTGTTPVPTHLTHFCNMKKHLILWGLAGVVIALFLSTTLCNYVPWSTINNAAGGTSS